MPPILVAFLFSMKLSGFYGDGTTPLESDLFYRINPKSENPAYYLRIRTGKVNAEFEPDRARLIEADVYASNKKTIVQRIHFYPMAKNLDTGLYEGGDVLAKGVDQGDFNFDGYLDFEGWLWEEGGSGGCPAIHYLFDPKLKRYVGCQQLDQLISTGFDDQEEVVRSYGRGGGMYSTAETYKWIKGKLVLLKKVERSRDDKGYYTEYSDFSISGHPHVCRVYLQQ